VTILAFLAIVVVGGAAVWYVIGEAHRTGRLVARLLSSRLGIPISVDAAVVEGSRLRLRGVALSAAGASVAVRAEGVDVDGGMLALLAPAGRRLSVAIRAASLTVHVAPAAPTGMGLDALYGGLGRLLDWPGELQLSVEPAEVRIDEQTYRISATASKPAQTSAAGAPATAVARVTIASKTAAPVAVDIALRHDARKGRLTLERYSVLREPDVRLEGHATWDTASGRFGGEAVLARLELGTVRARHVGARFSGVAAGPSPEAIVQVRADELIFAALPHAGLGATLDARLGLTIDAAEVVGLARVHQATLSVRRGDRPLARLTAASPSSGLWPLAIEVNADDLGELAFALPAVERLTGHGRFAGEILASQPLAWRGVIELMVPRAEVVLGQPVVASDLRATIPVRQGGASSPASPGALGLGRATGMGITLTSLTGVADLLDGRLLVRDLRYAHAGGRGVGWLEAILGAGPPRLRARLDADGVDLTTLLREAGVQIGQITGRLRYTLTAHFPAGIGYVALVRGASQEGGEVSIDAIQRLLESAAVQAESSVVLDQTLQNLRSFAYASLTAELRASTREARLDLSIVGRKRLGIFPAPVEAINLRNVPLGLLARTFARGTP
jgi:hypothetical protein